MGFIDEIKKIIATDYQYVYTENGAKVYSSTGSALLDLNYAVSSLRSADAAEVVTRFAKAFAEDRELSVKWLFFAGDVRKGMGERRLFKCCLWYLSEIEPDMTRRLLPLIAEYTRWDNLFVLLYGALASDVCTLVKARLEADEESMKKGEPASLLAKWLPSVQTKNEDDKRALDVLLASLGLKKSEYRKRLSALRSYLKITERLMSDGDWDKIDYSAVPSKANLAYADAFFKHDEERRQAFLRALNSGEEKINAEVIYPYEIIHRYFSIGNRRSLLYGNSGFKKALKDATLENLWRSLPDYVNGGNGTLCVLDGSGSMFSWIGKSEVTAFEVALSVSLYFAERVTGEFKDKFITFSETPKAVDLSHCSCLLEKAIVACGYSEVADTNIEAVFDLILSAAVACKNKDDVPDNILILSDMEFNDCACDDKGNRVYDGAALFDVIADKYAAAGVKMPRLIFWNINSRTIGVPVRVNEKGLAFVSGFSPSVCKMVLSSELDPLKCLTDVLNGERYLPVERAFKGI